MATEPDSLVETKLVPPHQRRATVTRRRLLDRLGRGLEARLVLVAAPAGFGKTTLLTTWVAENETGELAWLSLDERDADPARFWTYLLRSVDRARPGTATSALAQLQSGQTLPGVLGRLVNELSVQPRDLVLVLDDYHLAEGPELQPDLAFLVEHLPPQVHLVLSTRSDPALPLARLRARGELVEIRATDLRFTETEAGALLGDLGLSLSAEDLASLDARTEGWAAALQLAALSLQGREDPSRFIAGFAGDDRFVVDYLASEVLQRLPGDVRGFLLDTSVLARLTGSLCDAVSGRGDSRELLVALERDNLFLVALDDQRRWYRYHHLFGDVLRGHLAAERPGDVAALHRRASAWYAAAGDPEPAVSHALAAGDLDRACELVELAMPDLRRRRREDVIRRWAAELPPEVLADRPVLALGLIGGLSASNDFTGLDRRLRDIEATLARPANELVVVDRVGFERIEATLATYRSALALVSGDLPATVTHAELALALAHPGDHITLASASALRGLAAWPVGDLETAHRTYVTAARELGAADHVADVLGCSIAIADLELTLGRLTDAEATLNRGLALADAQQSRPVRGEADMQVGLSRVAWERGHVASAARHLDRAADLGDGAGLPQNPYRWRVALAALRADQGDPAAAVDLLDEAQRVHISDFSPVVRPIGAIRARLLAACGDLDGARRWLDHAGLDLAGEPTYLHEYELVTAARILLARHAAGDGAALGEALALLDRLLDKSEAGGRVATTIEVLVLLTTAHWSAGRATRSREFLNSALTLAEPEGWVRVFTAEGDAIRGPLGEAAEQGTHRSFAARLLADTGANRPAPPQAAPSLVDPLSERELEVLRLLTSELDGPEIARQLSVSLATVRTHTQHIYAKLGVNNRRSAVRRAHQLNLFAHVPRR